MRSARAVSLIPEISKNAGMAIAKPSYCQPGLNTCSGEDDIAASSPPVYEVYDECMMLLTNGKGLLVLEAW